MQTELPPIVKQAQRLVADIENAVRRFSRYHKYTIGQDLRSQAMAVTRAAFRAWRDQTRQVQRAHELAIAIDELKLSLQLGKDVKAFGSFREFEIIADVHQKFGKMQAISRSGVHYEKTHRPNLCDMEKHEAALLQPERAALRTLWWSRHQSLRTVGEVRAFPFGYGGASTRPHSGSDQQRRSLWAGQLSVGFAQRELPEQIKQSHDHSQRSNLFARGVGGNHRHTKAGHQGSARVWLGLTESLGDTVSQNHIRPNHHRRRFQTAGDVVSRDWHRSRQSALSAFVRYFAGDRLPVITPIAQPPSSAGSTSCVRSTWASYRGHFQHARHWRLQERLRAEFPWLPTETRHAV